MFDGTALFQRTARGLAEIQGKSHALTQSERLVLILVDGVTPFQGLQQRLKGLPEGRFERALQALLDKTLVQQITAPADIQQVGSEIVDQFLWQDTLDPITIAPAFQRWDRKATIKSIRDTDVAVLEQEPVLHPARIARVDFYLPLESVVKAADANQAPQKQGDLGAPLLPIENEGGVPAQTSWGEASKWRYWAIFVGIIFLMLLTVWSSTH